MTGAPSSGAYTTVGLWTDLTKGSPATHLPEGTDTADIPSGAVCTLDSTEEQTIAGLTVEGSLTVKSLLTVQTTSASGSGATSVSSSGLLDVASPDISGNTSTLETSTLTTASTPPGTPNLTIDPSAEVEVQLAATLSGDTTVTGLLDAANIDAFNGASVTLAGPGSVSGGGQLEAGTNAGIVFGPSSTWAIGPGNPVGSALKDGHFFVDGPLAFNTDFVNGVADVSLNDNGSTTAGSIGGTGSIDWWNGEFEWTGGTISVANGFTIDGNADFKLDGSDPKTLSTTMTNTGSGIADFGGTGMLTIKGPGMGPGSGAGALINNASAVLPMELSLPVLTGTAGFGFTPGTLTNNGYLDINGTSPMTISAPLLNQVSGVIDFATGAAPLTLSDTSGASVLNGKIGLNNDSLTISGLYTTTSGAFKEEYSASDLTTLTGTLTIDSGASADFDHLVLTKDPSSSTAGIITGAGDFSIDADGGGSNDYLTWLAGTMSGTGLTTIGPNATLTLSGLGSMGRDLDNHGKVDWSASGAIGFMSGLTLHNEKDGTFEFESGASLPTVDNDGMLEVTAGVTPTFATFTQSSTGTLQNDIASGSSWGKVKVTGSATLDGTLQAQLEDDYQPPSSTSFDVLDFASSSGQFADVEPQGWSATYNPTSVDLVSP